MGPRWGADPAAAASAFWGQGLGLEEFRSLGATEVVFTKFKRLLGSNFQDNAIGDQ